MQAKSARRGSRVGRLLIGIALLAATLGSGPVRAADRAEGDRIITVAACAAGMTLAPVSGDAWASSRGRPGEPY